MAWNDAPPSEDELGVQPVEQAQPSAALPEEAQGAVWSSSAPTEDELNGPAPQTSGLEALGRGYAQGITGGWGDELSARFEQGIAEAADFLGLQDEELSKIYDQKTYEDLRDEYRKQNQQAQQDHAGLYGTGLVAGGLQQAVIPGAGIAKGAGALKTAGMLATQGAVSGAGFSDAPVESTQFLEDTATGAGMNLALGGAIAGAPGVIKAASPYVKPALQKSGQVIKEGAEAIGLPTAVEKGKDLLKTGVEKTGKLFGMDTDTIVDSFKKGYNNQVDLLTEGGQQLLEDQVIKSSQRIPQVIRGSINRLTELKNAKLDAATNSQQILQYVDDAIAETQGILKSANNPADIAAAEKLMATLGNYRKAAVEVQEQLVPKASLEYVPGSKSAQSEVIRESADLVPDPAASSQLAEVGESGMMARPVEPNQPGQVFKPSEMEAANMAGKPLPAKDGIARQVDTTIKTTEPDIKSVERMVPEQVESPAQLGARRLDEIKQDLQSLPDQYKRSVDPLGVGKLSRVEKALDNQTIDLARQVKESVENVVGKDLSGTNQSISNLLKAAEEMPTLQQLAASSADPGKSLAAKEAVKNFQKALDEVPDSAWQEFLPNVPQRLRTELDKIRKNMKVLKAIRGEGGGQGLVKDVIKGVEGIAAKGANQAGLLARKAEQVAGGVNQSVAQSATKLKSMIDRAPDKFGQYAPQLQAASKRGSTSLAATNYLLSQKDPAYRKMIEELMVAETPDEQTIEFTTPSIVTPRQRN